MGLVSNLSITKKLIPITMGTSATNNVAPLNFEDEELGRDPVHSVGPDPALP